MIAEQGADIVNMNPGAVAVSLQHFAFPPALGHDVLDRCGAFFIRDLGGQHFCQRFSNGFLSAPAVDTFRALVPTDDFQREIGRNHGVRNVVDQFCVVVKLFLKALALCDVAINAHQPADAPFAVVQRDFIDHQPQGFISYAKHPEFAVDHAPVVLQQFLFFLPVQFCFFGGDQVKIGFADQPHIAPAFFN